MTVINLEDGTVFVVSLNKDIIFVRKYGDIISIAYVRVKKRKIRVKKVKINIRTGEEVKTQ